MGFDKIEINVVFNTNVSFDWNHSWSNVSLDNRPLDFCLNTSSDSFCFYHAQCSVNEYFMEDPSDPPGSLARILAEGCPKLEDFNGMNLTSLVKAGTWLEELRHHKGEGLGEDSFCSHCKTVESGREIYDLV